MSRHGRSNRTLRWAALLALLMATLAPSVAQALRHARSEILPWSQLCSATGGKRVVFEPQSDDPSSNARMHALEQCGVCASQHGGWAPPPVAPVVALRPDLQALAPKPRPLPALVPFAWLLAQPRAPPAA
jgi:hypothetical protein